MPGSGVLDHHRKQKRSTSCYLLINKLLQNIIRTVGCFWRVKWLKIAMQGEFFGISIKITNQLSHGSSTQMCGGIWRGVACFENGFKSWHEGCFIPFTAPTRRKTTTPTHDKENNLSDSIARCCRLVGDARSNHIHPTRGYQRTGSNSGSSSDTGPHADALCQCHHLQSGRIP